MGTHDQCNAELVAIATTLGRKVMRIQQLEGMLEDCLAYFEDRSDTIDGPNGPEPNRAMSMASAIKTVMEG